MRKDGDFNYHRMDLQSFGRIATAISATRYGNIDVLARAMIATGYDDDFILLSRTINIVKAAAVIVAGKLLFGKLQKIIAAAITTLELIKTFINQPGIDATWQFWGGRVYVSDIIEAAWVGLKEVLPLLGGVLALTRAVYLLNTEFVEGLVEAIDRQREYIRNENKQAG